MEIEAAVKLWADACEPMQKSLDKITSKLAAGKPTFQTVGGSVVTPAVAPTQQLVELQDRPNSGTIWEVKRFGVFGSDPHTPVGNQSFSNVGQVTSPGAAAVIATVNVPPGTYQISWTVTLEGTTATADANNFELTIFGQGVVATSVNGSAAGTVAPQITLIKNVGTGTGQVAVKSIAAGTVGAIYGAQLEVVPATVPGSLPNVYADVYAGSPVSQIVTSSETQQLGNLQDVVEPGLTIPTAMFVPRWSIMLRQNEALYALVYNPPASQQLVITARVAIWAVEDVERMRW